MALKVRNQQQQEVPPSCGGEHHITTLVRPAFPATLDFPSSKIHIQLQDSSFLYKLKTGETYQASTKRRCLERTKMSRRNGNGPKLDLKLNLSPPRGNPHVDTPSRSATVSPTSPPSSCVSLELNQDETCRYSSSPEATSMMLVGCPRCLMYVMLAEEDPRCPKCKSTVLLDVLHENPTTTTKKTRRS